ncbi:large neutral amino acids transporter small subunit 2-like [Physella acuta]|uniref:large neutral amino acids transporter small subunit 2-like n=1 Tax=Physella acuta TaxID=109671 RepID=UPI0027DE85B0|nr:large neutral amino acids transporter small subunit 2-like [Physella acuta]
MVVLNCVYMKYVTKIQTFLSGSKIIVLLIIIVSGIYNLATGENENFDAPFQNTTQEPGRFAVAIFYSIFSYGGWQVMTTLLEEIKDPARDPPRSVYISFAIVISKYILTNVAYLTLLSPAEVIASPAVASDFMNRMYSPLVPLVSVFVALTSIGALNASIMGHSRLLFAGARNGHMPQILGMVHTKYLTPWPSIFVYLVWGLIMLYTGGVTDMMDFISLFSTIMGVVVVASLLYLRWKKPTETRPYKVMFFIPVLEMIVNIAVLVLAIYQKPNKMGIGLAIFFAGIPVYWFGVLWKSKPKEFTNIVDNLTATAQKLFMLTKVKK